MEAGRLLPVESKKASVPKDALAVSATTRTSAEMVHALPLLPQNRRREKGGKSSAHCGTPREISSSARRFQKPYEGTCTNPSCNSWNPPVCQNDNYKQSALSYTIGQSAEQGTKEGWKTGSAAMVKNVQNLGCVSQDVVPPASASILRKGRNSSRSKLRLRYTPDALRSKENQGKETTIAGGVSMIASS